MTGTNLPVFFSDMVLSNRGLGHSIIALGFLIDHAQKLATKIQDKYKLNDMDAYVTGRTAMQSTLKKHLAEDIDPASLYIITSLLVGPGFINWEPESIWTTLSSEHHVAYSDQDKDELLAVITVKEIDTYYADASVYANTGLAMNGIEITPKNIPELSPAQMCWSTLFVELARKFLGSDNSYQTADFGYSPKYYMAASLHRAGFVLAPAALGDCQEFLDGLTASGSEVSVAQVRTAWNNVRNMPLEDAKKVDFDDSALESHVAKLVDCYTFVDMQLTDIVAPLKGLVATLEEAAKRKE